MAYITSLVALATTIGPRMAIVDHPSLVAASPRGCPHDPFHPFGTGSSTSSTIVPFACGRAGQRVGSFAFHARALASPNRA
jgi:hypothetical protein